MISDEKFLHKLFEKIVTAENKHYFCTFLLKLAATLQGVKRRYYNTSIFIAKGSNKSIIRWIDFHYWGTFLSI
jgi:hypothetical protein